MGDPPPSSHQFRPTRWSLVVQVHSGGAAASEALEHLCREYWFPLYAWCRRYGLNAVDAEDLVQSFFLEVLEKRLFTAADASRGKLRTFLLTALQRHVRDELGKARTQRRGGGRVVSFDQAAAEHWYAEAAAGGESAERLFDRQWALMLLDRAVERLGREAEQRGKTASFTALRRFLTEDGGAEDYARAAAALGMNEASVKVAVHRMRRKFREALHAEVAQTQCDEAGVREEIGYLREVLGGG